MSDLDKDKVLEDFIKAYTAANGKAPEIETKGGWYSVEGGKNVRLAQLAEMIDSMSGTPDKAEQPKPKKKQATAKKADKKSSGKFSVKDFYKKQISERNPGAILPR